MKGTHKHNYGGKLGFWRVGYRRPTGTFADRTIKNNGKKSQTKNKLSGTRCAGHLFVFLYIFSFFLFLHIHDAIDISCP